MFWQHLKDHSETLPDRVEQWYTESIVVDSTFSKYFHRYVVRKISFLTLV
jgi:hypothetical protein